MSPTRGGASLEARRPLLDDYDDDSPRSSDDILLPTFSPRFRVGGRRIMERKSVFTKSFVRLHWMCLFFAVGSFCWG